MLKKAVLIFLFISPGRLLAQSYEKEYESLFAWQVKQIDEFIERFDNSDSTLIKQYEQKHGSATPLTRERLIKSLFNAERKDWNFAEITEFIKQVDNKTKPLLLDFYEDNWYASLNCSVLWNGKPENAILKLKMQKLPNGSCKWVISDVDAKFLKQKNAAGISPQVTQPVLPTPEDSHASLNPVSNTTDFLNIDDVSRNPKNIGNYLAPSKKYSDDLCLFVNECIADHLKIVRANTITYNFLQIPGWDIEIQQYNRQTKNSGWLISKLIKLPS